MKRRSIRVVAVGLLAAGAIGVWPAAQLEAQPPVARDAGVIIRWNEITERTLIENAQPIPTSMLFYGFTSLAMYDAVVTIEGRYEPWSTLRRAKKHVPRSLPRRPTRTRCSSTTSRTRRQLSALTTRPRWPRSRMGSARCTGPASAGMRQMR